MQMKLPVMRMSRARKSVLRELALGVATLRTRGAPGPLFTIKPGSYTWPDTIQRLPHP